MYSYSVDCRMSCHVCWIVRVYQCHNLGECVYGAFDSSKGDGGQVKKIITGSSPRHLREY